MSFTPITTGEIASGEPVASTTQTKIKENFDDHESRLGVVETASVTFVPIILGVNGVPFVMDGVLKTTTNFSLTVTGIRILVDQAGSAGTLEIDVQRKRGVGAWESIFTVLPSIAYTAGDDALSSAGTLDVDVVDVEAGDILRLDITSIQTDMRNFLVRIDYNRG